MPPRGDKLQRGVVRERLRHDAVKDLDEGRIRSAVGQLGQLGQRGQFGPLGEDNHRGRLGGPACPCRATTRALGAGEIAPRLSRRAVRLRTEWRTIEHVFEYSLT